MAATIKRRLRDEASHLYSELNLGDLILEKIEAPDGKLIDPKIAAMARRYKINYPQDKTVRAESLDHLVDPTGCIAVASSMSPKSEQKQTEQHYYKKSKLPIKLRQLNSSSMQERQGLDEEKEENNSAFLSPNQSAPSPFRDAIRAELMRINSPQAEQTTATIEDRFIKYT